MVLKIFLSVRTTFEQKFACLQQSTLHHRLSLSRPDSPKKIANIPREKRAKRARQIAAALGPHGWKKLDNGIKLAVIATVK
ncbi:hypothetical protein AAC387_Pa03g1456 [Persea americana]